MAPSSIDAGPPPAGNPAATTLQDHLRRTLLPAARSTWVDCAQALRHDVQHVTDAARACVVQQAALTLADRGEMLAADYVARVAARLSSDIDPVPSRTGPALDRTPAAPQIALVDEQEYEFSVTVSTTAAHYERRFQNLLKGYGRAQTASTPGDAAAHQPAGIYTLLNPFLEQLSDLHLPVSVRIRALEKFRRHVLEALETIYDPACMRLRDADDADSGELTPEDPTAHAAGAAGRVRPVDLAGWRRLLPTPPPDSVASSGTAAAPVQPVLADLLVPGAGNSAMRATLVHLADATAPGNTAAPTYGNENALTSLYRRVGDALERAGLDVGALAPSEHDILRLTSLLFEQLLADDELSAPAAYLLVCLQIPVLAVALRNAAFFDDDAHPARRFIVRLAEIGAGWPSSLQPNEHREYAQVHRVVTDLIARIGDDPDCFVPALARLKALHAAHLQRVQRTDARLVERESGEARVTTVRGSVQRALDALLEETQPPALLRQFVRTTWSKVLVFVSLRHGCIHPEYQKALMLLRRVLDAAQTAADDAHEPRALRIPNLLAELEAQMASAGLPPSEIQRQCFALHAMLKDMVGSSGSNSARRGYLPEASDTPPSAPPDRAQISPADAARLRAITPGSWIRFRDEQAPDSERRFRVAGFCEPNGDIVLVDHRGVGAQAPYCGTGALLAALQNGTAHVLRPDAVLDRAFDALLRALASGVDAGH